MDVRETSGYLLVHLTKTHAKQEQNEENGAVSYDWGVRQEPSQEYLCYF